MDYYGINEPHLFAFVNDLQEQQFLQSAHRAVSKCNLWGWLKDYNPLMGFMFDNSNEVKLIRKEMQTHGISKMGLDYSYILIYIQYIAKNGYSQYECDYINNY